MANKGGDGKWPPYAGIGPVILWSEVMLSTGVIQAICDQVMLNVMKDRRKNYKEFKAVFYRISEEIILNYVIKVYVGDEKYLHLSVGPVDLPNGEGVIGLKGVQEDHKWNDLLEPFNYN